MTLELNEFGGTIDDEFDDLDNAPRGDAVTDDDTSDDSVEETQPVAEDTSEDVPEPDETRDDQTPEESESEEEPEKVNDSDSDPEETPEEEDTKPKKQNRIPLERFNKEIEKRRAAEEKYDALEAKLQELESKLSQPQQPQEQKPAEPEVDIEKEIADAFNSAFDGEPETAAAKIAEIIRKSNQQAVLQAQESSTKNFSQMTFEEKQTELLNQTAQQVVVDYPVLAQDSEEYDAGIFEEVIELRDAYIAQGKLPYEALQKASEVITRSHGVKKASEQVVEEKAAPKRDIKKSIDVAAKTPPKTSGDLDTEKTKLSIEDMTEEDFDKLSAEDLRRLRGDKI